eukprot:TRINITY_DN1381_c0_g2_i13.p1 TRINITY_DN1381_c0_g2~~TRINITY_DN1381_c0_g2_i13.p1  ORF type:complete len:336 (-),score=11.03 TRINITY_DN1381_c0_g2_i13:455-1462(-)
MGSFGIVIQAVDKLTREVIAIKILSVEDYLNNSKEEFETALFQVERGLKFGRAQKHVLITMERARCSLAQYTKSKGGKLPEEERKTVIKQLLSALQYLHISDIVHRNISPKSIMSDVDLEGAVRLTGVGIASKVSEVSSCEPFDPETLRYESLEQLNGRVCATVFTECNNSTPTYGQWELCCMRCCQGRVSPLRSSEITCRGVLKSCRGKLIPKDREAKHLICHLCNVKPSGRYSSTEALEYPWITGVPKILLSYDEKLALQPLKSAVLAAFFTVKAKKAQPKLKPRRKYTNVETVHSGEIEFRAAQERIKRRDWYAKKVKLMQKPFPLSHHLRG